MCRQPGWRPDLIHRPGEGTSLREGWCGDLPENQFPIYSSDCCGGCLGDRIERYAVLEHAMHDYRELACQRDLRLAHAGSLGDPHCPALKLRAAFDWLCQHDVSGLVERLAHRGVADLADPPRVVCLTGLILLRRQSAMRSRLLRPFEPCRRDKRPGTDD